MKAKKPRIEVKMKKEDIIEKGFLKVSSECDTHKEYEKSLKFQDSFEEENLKLMDELLERKEVRE